MMVRKLWQKWLPLGNTVYWDEDLNKIEGLTEAIATSLKMIEEYGIKEAFSKLS
mgnify:CR=1 FL=1